MWVEMSKIKSGVDSYTTSTGKQPLAHTWNLCKTITGAVGFEVIRLDPHVWTQDIYEKQTVESC